jgi:anaerobic magnesium-protoporphyrin IX monomethyl ester cyclase
MKLLLVQPPIEDFYNTSIRTYPLGLLYLAAKVADLCEVSLLDARTGFKPKMPEGEPPEGVHEYYRADRASPFSLFQKYRRFGMSRQALEDAFARESPDVVAISSLFTTYSLEALEAARAAKAANPRIVTIVGGTHPTLFPGDVLSDPSVDLVIRGEGESPLRSLMQGLTGNGDGRLADVCFKDGNQPHIGPVNVEKDIDLLPDRSLVRADKYRIGKRRYTTMLTSRGCPNRCSFCGKPPVPYRRRSLSAIDTEIGDCLGRGIEAIDFQDDMLTGDIGFFRQILALLVGRGLTLSAMNGIHSEGLDETTLGLMYEAGFKRLNFSLVDASDTLLSLQSRTGVSSFVRLLPYLEASPFLVEVHFIVGLPKQTPADVIETIIFLMDKRLLLGPSVFYLAPGSPTFKKAVGQEWQPLLKSLRSSAMLPANPAFPRPVTYTLMKLVRFVNYIKGLLDRQEISHTISASMDSPHTGRPIDREALRTLLSEKRFVWQNSADGAILEEPQDVDLVHQFFTMAKGRRIKGFRTNHQLVVDT